jgi:hypothetical protein
MRTIYLDAYVRMPDGTSEYAPIAVDVQGNWMEFRPGELYAWDWEGNRYRRFGCNMRTHPHYGWVPCGL